MARWDDNPDIASLLGPVRRAVQPQVPLQDELMRDYAGVGVRRLLTHTHTPTLYRSAAVPFSVRGDSFDSARLPFPERVRAHSAVICLERHISRCILR